MSTGWAAAQATRIRADVAEVLARGEEILAVAVQNPINSPLKKDSAVVTNRRFIIYRPKLFGRMELEDFLWQDVNDIHIQTQLLGATITVTGKRKSAAGSAEQVRVQVTGLDKKQALRLYATSQEVEQQWREKNRIRVMEEERARAGGVYVQSPAYAHPGSTPGGAGGDSIEQRLAQLKRLHEQHLISDAEYEARKAQIIAEL